MNKIYTAGYIGHTPTQLREIATRLSATIIDSRLRPFSRIAGWSIKELQKSQAGYVHIANLGNLGAFDGGPMRLQDEEQGLTRLLQITEKSPVILLCACIDPTTCHRTLISRLLAARGVPTEELRWDAPPKTEGIQLPAKALSIRQPWAWLIIRPDVTDVDRRLFLYQNGEIKDVENRNWRTNFRGEFAVHASTTLDKSGYDYVKRHFPEIPLPAMTEFERGGIIGTANLVDCVSDYDSCWFFGEYGFLLRDSKPREFEPMAGSLNFFPTFR